MTARSPPLASTTPTPWPPAPEPPSSPADPDNPVDPDSQADPDNPADPDSPADPDNQADQADPAGAATGPARSPSPLRQTGFAVARALVVLVVAAVAYQAVVPNVVVVRGRLARLVLSKPGVPAYDKTKAQSGEQNDAQTGLAAVTAAAKQSPDKTGIYSIEWSPSQDSGAGMIAILFPTEAAAATGLAQIRSQQLAAGSYSSNALTRASTSVVAGVPGSYASVYRPSSKQAGAQPDLAVTAFRYGRVVAVSEVANTEAIAPRDVNTVTTGEYANLRRLGTGFGLTVTRRPVMATSLWAAGAIVLAAAAALGPVVRRRRRQNRQRAYEQEMSSRVIVGRQVIVKHRR